MSRYLHAISQATSTVRLQRWTIGVLAVITLAALAGWRFKETQLTAHIPPDLSNGASLKIGGTPQVPTPNVYVFGFYIWQQINNWPKDGGTDYSKQIFALQAYITPACRTQLDADLKAYGVTTTRLPAGELLETGERVRFTLPTGHVMELYADKTDVGNGQPYTNPDPWTPQAEQGIAPVRFDHCLLYGPDLEGNLKLLTEVLGFSLVEREH